MISDGKLSALSTSDIDIGETSILATKIADIEGKGKTIF